MSGCSFCFNNPRLRKNSLNHDGKTCRLDPANGFKSKASFANQAQLKAAIRDVLNEPADTKRSRDEMEDGQILGEDKSEKVKFRTDDMAMDSDGNDSDTPKSSKKQKH